MEEASMRSMSSHLRTRPIGGGVGSFHPVCQDPGASGSLTGLLSPAVRQYPDITESANENINGTDGLRAPKFRFIFKGTDG
jgi:hypothetical protein